MNEKPTQAMRSARQYDLPAAFGRLRDELEHIFDEVSVPRPVRSILNLPGRTGFSPILELADRKDRYEVAVELPGLAEKDIDVEFADGVLSISGEKRSESEDRGDNYLVCERSYGSFRRRLVLPDDIDPDSIIAKYRRGVLRIEMKKDKRAMDRVRKIAVS